MVGFFVVMAEIMIFTVKDTKRKVFLDTMKLTKIWQRQSLKETN